jgi:hypothetical protein
MVQNYYLAREYDRLDHRLDVGDAYFNKALIDSRRKLEDAYYAERRQTEMIMIHCKTHKCEFPPELEVMLPEIKIEPIDKILPKKKGEEKDEH